MDGVEEKLACLRGLIRQMGSALVAFSGGVDSTFLLKVTRDILDGRALAITAVSPTYPQGELEEARGLALMIGAKHEVITSHQMDIPQFVENGPRRCYFCKRELYELLTQEAKRRGYEWVLDGTNLDDLSDYRPGRDAVKELNVRSPLAEAGLTKGEIRELSRRLGLSTWKKPSAACLSSRFPHGTVITIERLTQVDKGERLLKELGFTQVRVRYHGEIARIEIDPSEMARFLDPDMRKRVVEGFERLGFKFVTLDLKGYRTGSLNPA